jgi:hypothetical protein
VDEKVLTELEALVPLAPVHQPQCILEEDTCGSLGLGGELLAAPWAPQTTPVFPGRVESFNRVTI